jgi:hypothetical protein
MSNEPRSHAPIKRVPEWVIEDLRAFAEVLADNGNIAASRKLLAQISRGSGISRTLLKTAWNNTFTGAGGENPADRGTREEFGRLLANIDELARPEVNYNYLLRSEPRVPGRPTIGDEPLNTLIRVLFTASDAQRIDDARGTESRSHFIRRAVLATLGE